MPLEAASAPIGGLNHCWKDYWWVYMEGRGVLFWITEPHKARAHLYPQANANKEITERIRAALYQWPQELGKLEVKQIPLVFGYAWAD